MFLSELICFPSSIAFCMMSVFVHVHVCVCVCVCVCVMCACLGEWQGKQLCFPDVRRRREMSGAGRTEESLQFHSLVVAGISAVGVLEVDRSSSGGGFWTGAAPRNPRNDPPSRSAPRVASGDVTFSQWVADE